MSDYYNIVKFKFIDLNFWVKDYCP
jgi:hypothetical protein